LSETRRDFHALVDPTYRAAVAARLAGLADAAAGRLPFPQDIHMNLIPSFRRALAVFALGLACLTGLAPAAQAQSVASLACVPAVIGGGSGVTATCTVRLGAAAPVGGAVVTLASSLTALAASVPRVTVPAGQTSVSFAVATNAHYRLEAGLPFNVAISATRVTTANATLNITAPPRPADFSSGVPPGARFAWQGSVCGGIEPIGGRAGVLYQCSGPTANAYGNCSVKQECPIGCRRVTPNGTTLKDFCATSGPNPVAISKSYVVSGERVAASLVTEAVVGTRLTQGLPGAISNQGVVGGIGGVSVNASVFPHDGGITIPSGSSSVGFAVATSAVPTPTFIDVTGNWGDAGSVITTNGRIGQTWLAIVPPEPAPALPLPTLGDFKITGGNPVVGGQGSIGQLDVSGVTSAGGPTLVLTSSHPNIAAVLATFTLPAGPVLGQQVPITTQPPAVDTAVTLTATDSRNSFSAQLMVLAPAAAPLLQSVSVAPTNVVDGASATGTVTLSTGAPSGGAVVTLSTPLPAVAQLPASINVPAGATNASFAITTTSVVETFSVNVFADLAGTGRQALLMVTPGVVVTTGSASLALSPTRVSGGNASTGTVTLATAAPSGGAVVALASSSGVVSVPASVTVPAGATSASFTVATGRIRLGIIATITAAYAGTTGTATLSVCSSPGFTPMNCLLAF
jgi:trimeric autotransporter adhesin